MATRKGRGQQAVRNKQGGFPGWGYAIVGIAIGALAAAVVMHRASLPGGLKGPQPNANASAEHAAEPGLEPAASSTAPKKPQYDFYSVLPEKEVRIPDEQISAQARAEQQQAATAAASQPRQPVATPSNAPASTAPVRPPAAITQTIAAAPPSAVASPGAGSAGASAGSSGYLLQVGAFPSAADAESLKARMALQGFVANVQSVTIGGQAYHRVRLGPFRSATELEATKQRLSAAGINAIALKEVK